MKLIKYIFLILLISFFSSCCKDSVQNCSVDISNTIKSIETVYNCTNTTTTMQLNVNDEYKIITNSNDYNNFVIGTCHPSIDFSNYNLIIGTIHSDLKVNIVKYYFYQSCEPNYYKLNIKYNIDNTQSGGPNYTYTALVPKNYIIDFLKVSYLVN